MFQVEKSPQELSFGRQGESNILSYAFDFSEWAADWPGGMASMTVILPNQTQPQPIPDTQAVVEGSVITLHVLDNLTGNDGRGTLIVHYVAGPNKKRSRLIEFVVEKGHEPAGEAPEHVQDWIDDATSKLGEVYHFIGETIEATESANAAAGLTNDAIDRANAISEALEGIAPLWADVDISVSALSEGTAPTASITQDETGTLISLGIPKGDTGAQGPVGNVMYATFDIDTTTGDLVMTTPVGYTGPTFILNETTGDLEVVVNA